MSSPTDVAPVAPSSAKMARETSSRGASSSTKRSPPGPCRVAPSPRIASVTRKPSRPGIPITAVGWNCRNSRSARSAPAAWAIDIPMPSEPGGFVVRDHSAAAPPVARIVARARIARPSSSTTPAQRPSCIQAPAARAPSSTATSGSSTTSAESWRTMRRPVALPPAWTTRRTEWPPSRPSARTPRRSASKRTPSLSRSRTRAGASCTSTCAAERRTRSRPAASVSARWRLNESSTASAAAIPPCAQ